MGRRVRSRAYTGPDDWGETEYEWQPDSAEEPLTLIVVWEAYLDRATGDSLVITDVRDAATQAQVQLPLEEVAEIQRWLEERYEPTQDL